MKAQTKMIAASLVVIMLALSAVGGITYSWFSDTETADIEISTAKVQMDTTFQYLDGDIWEELNENDGAADLTIAGFKPGDVYKFKVTYSDNASNITTYHRLYAEISGPVTKEMSDYITLNGVNLPQISDDDTKVKVVLSDWEKLDASTNDETPNGKLPFTNDVEYSLIASTFWSTQPENGFAIKLVSELYQEGAPREVVVPITLSENNTTISEVMPSGNGSETVEVQMNFADVNNIDGKTLSMETTSTPSAGFEIQGTGMVLSFKIDEGSYNFVNANNEPVQVPITVTIPGNHKDDNLRVVYLGETSTEEITVDPSTISYDNTTDATTFTFTTSHFSEYLVLSDKTELTASDSDSFAYVLGNVGGNIVLDKDLKVNSTIVVKNDAVLDLNDKTIEADGDFNPLIRIVDEASLTIKNGIIRNDEGYVAILGASDEESSGDLKIEGGSYYGSTSVFSVTKGTLTIEDGYFQAKPYKGTYTYTINCIDANYNKSAFVNINGGTFYNFDPANNAAEGPNTDFTKDNVNYKIVLGASTANELKEILTIAGSARAGNSTITIFDDIDMTNFDWKPIYVNGYQGAGIVTINGNNKTITGLSAPLFSGGFAGKSGIVISDLTVKNSKITSTNTNGSGAFIESVDSMETISLTNCHLIDSEVNGSRTGGLIGWTSGYSNVNDGPVKTYVTINGCSVIGCKITGSGSVGAINGHAGASDWTYTTITDCTVMNNILTSNDSGDWRIGVVVGTANSGEVIISGIIESNNTIKQTNKDAPEGQSNLYGRFVPNETGILVINGKSLANTSDQVSKLIKMNVKEIILSEGDFTIDLYDIDHRDELIISGQGADTKLSFLDQQVRLSQFNKLTISNCAIEHMATKSWGHLVFGSSDNGGTYTISNCIFNGQGTQGIYINQNVGATFKIENCTFNGDFGGEGAITIQNNEGVDITVNVTECSFNDIPETSHSIYMLYAYNGFTLNADGVKQYWKVSGSVA